MVKKKSQKGAAYFAVHSFCIIEKEFLSFIRVYTCIWVEIFLNKLRVYFSSKISSTTIKKREFVVCFLKEKIKKRMKKEKL